MKDRSRSSNIGGGYSNNHRLDSDGDDEGDETNDSFASLTKSKKKSNSEIADNLEILKHLTSQEMISVYESFQRLFQMVHLTNCEYFNTNPG